MSKITIVSKRIQKWLLRGLASAVALALVGFVIGAWLLRSWTNRPPALPADTSVTLLQPETRDGKVWLGQSSFTRREGLMVVHLKGSPLEMGYATGVLLREQMHTLESEFLTMVRGYVPNPATLTVLKWFVIHQNRHLSEFVPEDYRMEILGEIMGCPDSHPELGDYYNRMLNYHAAHDVSYMMIDNPLVSRAGCTSFGVWGDASVDGHLLTGRNFDWEAAEVFGRDRVVQLYEPDDGIPFISLSWAGMVGVVSGMNRAGLSVTINGAPSSLPKKTATPVAIVAREVLQKAHNLGEAIDIIREAQVFVSTLWLLGSRADGTFVVVEKTPDRTQVHEAESQRIVCANHFRTPGLRDAERNQNQMQEATSVARQNRLAELLEQTSRPVSPKIAAEMLRDRSLTGGVFAGNGHRASLNPFIATHATIMDLSRGIFWASVPPHQLGKFVAFDVNDFSRELPESTLEEDPVLASGDYARAQQARESLDACRKALAKDDAQAAFQYAEKAERLNPGFYQNMDMKGRALQSLGKTNEARAAFRSALDRNPAFMEERRELERLVTKIEGDN